MKICTPIVGPTACDVQRQIACATREGADLIELRTDLFRDGVLQELLPIPQGPSLPQLLCKVRDLQLVERCMELGASYLDIEFSEATDALINVLAKRIQVVASVHNYKGTPSDLEGLLEAMRKRTPYAIHKIACAAQSSMDALRMLGLMKRNPGVLWVSMGPCATFTRVLAPIFGVPWTYAALEESLATDKGQLTLREMREVYGVHRLTPKTKIYGLIGGCVAQSIGHCVHNAVFRECGVDAVYVKMNVEKEELSRFLNGAAELGIRGLSVTTPLKETVGILPQVNRVSCSGAINTLLFRSDGIFGYNTDGQAALDALEAKHGSVHGQKVVVLGAGGAARAIVVEACRRGASVTVLNRNFHRARECIRDAPAERGLLSLLPRLDYDVLIQATSATESPVPLEAIRPGVTAMEIITSPQETQFVQFAKQRGSKIVLGGEMFVLQAMGQYAIWFRNPNVDAAKRVFIAEMERRL